MTFYFILFFFLPFYFSYFSFFFIYYLCIFYSSFFLFLFQLPVFTSFYRLSFFLSILLYFSFSFSIYSFLNLSHFNSSDPSLYPYSSLHTILTLLFLSLVLPICLSFFFLPLYLITHSFYFHGLGYQWQNLLNEDIEMNGLRQLNFICLSKSKWLYPTSLWFSCEIQTIDTRFHKRRHYVDNDCNFTLSTNFILTCSLFASSLWPLIRNRIRTVSDWVGKGYRVCVCVC